MRRRGRVVLLLVLSPPVLLLACITPRSLQGPVRGRVRLSAGAPRDDLVARLRCFGYGIHGAHGAYEAFRVVRSGERFVFPLAYRGLFPAGCNLEVMHPLYRMESVPLERRFLVDVGELRLQAWPALLEEPEGLSIADIHRHLFYLHYYHLKGFEERERGELAEYVPGLHALLERGLRELPPMDRDRFGSTEGSLKHLRSIEQAVGYVRPPIQRALCEVASAGDVEAVRALLAQGADPDAWDETGQAAIHHAARAKHTEVVRALLLGGAAVDRREEGLGDTSLIAALRVRDASTATLLIESGADVTLENHGAVPLALAAHDGTLPLLRAVIERGGVARARESQHLVAAIHGAARSGQTEAVATLLAAGVPVDIGLPGFTAFMQASWKGWLPTARLLLEAGADPDAVSVTGKTALAYAREENRTEVVAWLSSIGAADGGSRAR